MSTSTYSKPMIYVPALKHPNNAQYRLTLNKELYEIYDKEFGTKTIDIQLIFNGNVPLLGRVQFPEDTYDDVATDLGARLLMEGKYGQTSSRVRDVVVVKHVPTNSQMERILEETESEIEDLSIRIYQVPGSGLSPIAETEWLETLPLEEEDQSDLFGFVFRVAMSPARP